MKHFLEINQLSRGGAKHLIERAFALKHSSIQPAYPLTTVANLFYENSTRTRVSFEMAARRLSMPVINLDLQNSSESKGETLTDTIANLAAMGIAGFVIRHSEEGLPKRIAEQFDRKIHVINAGDGKHEHPTQAMLDMMTIMEQKPYVDQIKIAIVGDLRHSRVANSMQNLCKLLQVKELVLVAPSIWLPEKIHHGRTTTSLQEGIADADVVICLRVQKERLKTGEELDFARYHRDYAITANTVKYAKADAMVMHPGPINRGVELDSEVADGPQAFILKQVQNGVFMRMAILEALMQHAS